MNSRIQVFFKWIDMFGIPIPVKFANKNSFKSPIGGITTLILYSLALAYAILIFYQWGSGQILPKISTSIKTLYEGQVQLDAQFMTIAFFNASVSAFNKSSCLILPLLIELRDQKYQEPRPIFQELGQSSRGLPELQIQLPSLAISIQNFNKIDIRSFSQYFLLLTPCTPFLSAKYNYTCASDQEIQDFVKQAPPILEIKTTVSQFNSNVGKNQQVTKSQYPVFQLDSVFYQEIIFRSELQQIDTGILFQEVNESIHISSYSMMNQQVSNSQIHKIFGMEAYVVFFIQMDNFQDELTIVYVKLSEVLAMIGSITATLMMVGNMMTKLNSYLLDQEISIDLLNRYSNHQIEYKQSYFHGIKDVCLNGQHLDNKDYKKLKTRLLEQFNIVNILKNINNIQEQLDLRDDILKLDTVNQIIYSAQGENELMQQSVRQNSKEVEQISVKEQKLEHCPGIENNKNEVRTP